MCVVYFAWVDEYLQILIIMWDAIGLTGTLARDRKYLTFLCHFSRISRLSRIVMLALQEPMTCDYADYTLVNLNLLRHIFL